jgi:predicted nuclease with TOPRIM domain
MLIQMQAQLQCIPALEEKAKRIPALEEHAARLEENAIQLREKISELEAAIQDLQEKYDLLKMGRAGEASCIERKGSCCLIHFL